MSFIVVDFGFFLTDRANAHTVASHGEFAHFSNLIHLQKMDVVQSCKSAPKRFAALSLACSLP